MPRRIDIKRANGLIEEGYELQDENIKKACDVWLEAWKIVKSMAASIEELDELPFDYFISNWVLLIKKNHDYGEAWRDMKITSITDQIFVKLFRCKKILENGKLEVSEGLEAQFSDIINYAVFALIKLRMQEEEK